ncbi:MAG: glycosyltransferase family 2 protein [Archaeoglobaceae archaeon]
MRIAIFGPSKRFLSGISYYTIRLSNALSAHGEVKAIPMASKVISQTSSPLNWMKLSVIVATTPQRLQQLSLLLKSLDSQVHLPDEIILVTDKGKKDLIASELKNSRIKIVESDGEGLSKARNRGIMESIGDILIFIDDDVILTDQNVFSKVLDAFQDEKIAVYGVQVKPRLKNSVKLPDQFNWIFGCTDDEALRPVGAFFAVRREIFEKVGVFKEGLGRKKSSLISGEETEFFIRVEKLGLKIFLDSSVKVHHIVTNRGLKYVLRRSFAEGRSKARFKDYDLSVEKKYLIRYLKSPIGLVISVITLLGFIFEKISLKVKKL